MTEFANSINEKTMGIGYVKDCFTANAVYLKSLKPFNGVGRGLNRQTPLPSPLNGEKLLLLKSIFALTVNTPFSPC
jgi:hypothetical protein